MPRVNVRQPALDAGRRAKTLSKDLLTNATASQLVQMVVEKRQKIGMEILELGQLLNRVKTTKAYLAVAPSFEQFLREYKIAGRSTAFKVMAIAENNPGPNALARGIEYAYGVFRYATLEDELLAHGIDPKTVVTFATIEDMSARQLAELNRQLAAALHPQNSPTPGPTPPPLPPPPNRPKTPAARKLQKALRSLGAKRAIVSSFRYEGMDWVKIKMPESQIQYIDTGG